MEKAKMMLSSVLYEKDKIDRSVLIRYYIDEYKSSNPIFLSQFFKLMLKYIYENRDFDMLDLLIDNFYDELCMYGHTATKEFNNLLSYFILSNKVLYVIKVSPLIPEIGNKTTLKLIKNFIVSIEKSKYTNPKELFIVKKSLFDLDSKLKTEKATMNLDIIDQGIFIKWKKFEKIV
ncbi:MAG: hypothetical protein ACK4F9_04045 [Brevinematia bacterium]